MAWVELTRIIRGIEWCRCHDVGELSPQSRSLLVGRDAIDNQATGLLKKVEAMIGHFSDADLWYAYVHVVAIVQLL